MPADSEPRSLIVIGASAGGVEALTTIVRALPVGFPAPIAVVLHITPSGRSVLPAILSRAGVLEAGAATDGMALRPGCIYVAPPDHHLLVGDGALVLRQGPRENGHRPAIDPLFTSAAVAYGRSAIGVILTGTLDDGAAGLAAIKSRGGVAVVQDPEDALYRGMPDSALERVEADHVAGLQALGPLLVDLVRRPVGGEPVTDPAPAPAPAPEELAAGPSMPAGEAVGLGCPECGGALWYLDEEGAERYRCRIGHAYSEQSLVEVQGRALEVALWTALRALEERAAIMRRMARRAREGGHTRTADRFLESAGELDQRAQVIREHVAPVAIEGYVEAVGE